MADDMMCMHYALDRLRGIVTQTDLYDFINEIEDNLEVNAQQRSVNYYNPNNFDDFDVQGAIDDVKRDYINRAMKESKNVSEAAKLLGLKNYQTLQNWMEKLGDSK